jgi:hypothetical protein
MDDHWFDETLTLIGTDLKLTQPCAQVDPLDCLDPHTRKYTQALVRARRPRWRELTAAESVELSTKDAVRYFLVRLGFTLRLPFGPRPRDLGIVAARCMTYLWAPEPAEAQPTVHTLYPHLFDEDRRLRITIQYDPHSGLKPTGITPKRICFTADTGYLEPACAGFVGRERREPYWNLTIPHCKRQEVCHFWLVIQKPAACASFRLALRVEAQLKTAYGPLWAGSKNVEREKLPSVSIPRY